MPKKKTPKKDSSENVQPKNIPPKTAPSEKEIEDFEKLEIGECGGEMLYIKFESERNELQFTTKGARDFAYAIISAADIIDAGLEGKAYVRQ